MTSRGLEISNFGTFAGVGPTDTINDVRVTVNAFASSALMDPPTYQLWNGTTAQIGTDQTGVASTNSAHLDHLTFTGATYAQLPNLRLRVYAHPGSAPEGATQYVDYVSIEIFYTVGNPSPDAHIYATAIQGTTIIPIPKITATSGGGTVTLPARGIFYYPWFSGGSYPAYPGAWDQGGIRPWTQYHPVRGYYNSTDTNVVDGHIRDMIYGKFDFGISSWWGQASKENTNLGILLARAAALGTGFKWCVYYEAEGNTIAGVSGSPSPTVSQITNDLNYLSTTVSHHPNYLHINNKPVIFVYGGAEDDNTVTPTITNRAAARWSAANAAATENWFYVLKVYNGYAADHASYPASGWHQYGPGSNVQTHGAWHYTISPGFWLATEVTPRLVRDVNRFATDVQNMLNASVDFKLVTSFNEWGEGHIVEASDGGSGRDYVGSGWPSASGYGTYLDILHNDGLTNYGVTINATVISATSTIPRPVVTTSNNATIIAKLLDCGNLISEASFEDNLITGWSGSGNPAPTVAISTVRAHSGTHSMKVDATGAWMFFPSAWYDFAGTPGTAYDMSAWLYVPSGNPVATMIAPGQLGDATTATDTWQNVHLLDYIATGMDSVGVSVGDAPATVYVDDVRVYQRVIPVPVVSTYSGPNYGGATSDLGDGQGSWANPTFASGTDNDQYATWAVP